MRMATSRLVGRAALSVARGHTKKVDVIEITWEGGSKFGLSCVGWGLAGAVGLQADKMRWVPGQKQARYDIAGFITLLKVLCFVCLCLSVCVCLSVLCFVTFLCV